MHSLAYADRDEIRERLAGRRGAPGQRPVWTVAPEALVEWVLEQTRELTRIETSALAWLGLPADARLRARREDAAQIALRLAGQLPADPGSDAVSDMWASRHTLLAGWLAAQHLAEKPGRTDAELHRFIARFDSEDWWCVLDGVLGADASDEDLPTMIEGFVESRIAFGNDPGRC